MYMDSNEAVREHYEGLLAEHYTWLYGGLASNIAGAEALFRELAIQPGQAAGRAADLGCGSGFQSLPLARAGFAVDAVDLSPSLLRELEANAHEHGIVVAEQPAPGQLRLIEQDLVTFLQRSAPQQYELLVCMGDTLTHLPSFSTVQQLLDAAARALQENGRLLLGFRDLSVELQDLDRFIPVQSDGRRIFTCFLEYEVEHVRVHDLIYCNTAAPGEPAAWQLTKSWYRKLRLGETWLSEYLLRTGFRVAHRNCVRGFITLLLEKV